MVTEDDILGIKENLRAQGATTVVCQECGLEYYAVFTSQEDLKSCIAIRNTCEMHKNFSVEAVMARIDQERLAEAADITIRQNEAPGSSLEVPGPPIRGDEA